MTPPNAVSTTAKWLESALSTAETRNAIDAQLKTTLDLIGQNAIPNGLEQVSATDTTAKWLESALSTAETRNAINAQLKTTPELIGQNAIPKWLEQVSVAGTMPERAHLETELRAGLLGENAEILDIDSAVSAEGADDLAGAATWRARRIFQCYLMILVTIVLM